MVQLTAVVVTRDEGSSPSRLLNVETEADAVQVVGLLMEPWAAFAELYSTSTTIDLYVSGEYGYLTYNGPEGYFEPVGEPESPDAVSEKEFSAGSGLSFPDFSEVVVGLISGQHLPPGPLWRVPAEFPDGCSANQGSNVDLDPWCYPISRKEPPVTISDNEKDLLG